MVITVDSTIADVTHRYMIATEGGAEDRGPHHGILKNNANIGKLEKA